MDYISTFFRLKNNENIHAEEEKYLKLKSVLPFIKEKFNNGEISQQQYSDFMQDYKRMEDIYGVDD